MKYLVVLLVVGLGLWLLLRGRGGAANKPAPRKDKASAAPVQMVACAHCGVNLPRPEALTDGRGEVYCSNEHRNAGPV
jgi:uncharacterized protein